LTGDVTQALLLHLLPAGQQSSTVSSRAG
jgi:hypothetical protein